MFASVGSDKPRKAGANTLRHLFDKFLKGTFRVMEKRQSSYSPSGQMRVSRTCRQYVLMSRFRKGVPFRSDVALLVYGLAVATIH